MFWGSEDVIGIYPLFPDGTCRFLVFDFDNHEKGAEKQDFANADETWYEEVNALRKICMRNGIDALIERSRSGRGPHVWIFFRKPMPASTARNFGFLLLDKGAAAVNLKSFWYYDRMYPSQDVANSIGNLVALPLQGRALINGNSAFVDENWNAYPEQWGKLFQTKRLSQEEVEQYIAKWQDELFTGEWGDCYSNDRKRSGPSDNLIMQWEDKLKHFLEIDEEPPEYLTKSGRIKKRIRVVGTLKGGKDTMTGIIDIAMIGSLYKKGKFHEKINSYGMIIMDECHHAASATAQEILKKVNAKYVYGISATPVRSDKLEKINFRDQSNTSDVAVKRMYIRYCIFMHLWQPVFTPPFTHAIKNWY